MGRELFLCDESHVMARPWAEAGYECVCVDLQGRESEPGIEHVQADVREYRPDFPVVFWGADACWKLGIATGAPGFIENPVGKLSTAWGGPDFTFDPWQYGDGYQKRTCIWGFNGFVMPPFSVAEKPAGCDQRIHRMAPGPDRARRRSETPPGFARAVFEANAPCRKRGAA